MYLTRTVSFNPYFRYNKTNKTCNFGQYAVYGLVSPVRNLAFGLIALFYLLNIVSVERQPFKVV